MDELDATTSASLTTDRAFDLLGNGRRRRAVSALRERDGAMALRDLAEEVVERAPEDDSDSELPEDRRKRIAASLHHCHLPKLDDADVVDYDPVANEVEASQRIDALGPYFRVIEGP